MAVSLELSQPCAAISYSRNIYILFKVTMSHSVSTFRCFNKLALDSLCYSLHMRQRSAPWWRRRSKRLESVQERSHFVESNIYLMQQQEQQSLCAADRTDVGVRCSLTEGQKLHCNNRSTTDKRNVVLMFSHSPPPPPLPKGTMLKPRL